jgi:ferredoxin
VLKKQLQQQAPAAPAKDKETVAKVEAASAEFPKVADEAPSPTEPYIETSRCTTCNECTNQNNRMFAYDENKQAYIKDVTAGTYRDLVEAAEKCQVGIIHPGKPRNPDEPDLEDLMRRAEAFE